MSSQTGMAVRAYAAMHPSATIRDIQKKLGISSPSVVHFHLKVRSKRAKAEVLTDALHGIIGAIDHPGDSRVACDLVKRIAINAMIAVGEIEG